MTGTSYDVHSSEFLKKLRWQPLLDRTEETIKRHYLCKIRNHDLPSCLENMFTISDNNNYNLRSNETNFTLPKPNTKYLKKSISYSGVLHWNALLMRAKKSQISIDQFKGRGIDMAI